MYLRYFNAKEVVKGSQVFHEEIGVKLISKGGKKCRITTSEHNVINIKKQDGERLTGGMHKQRSINRALSKPHREKIRRKGGKPRTRCLFVVIDGLV